MQKKILVTGGCGYIGSHTCIELLKQGFQITILDSLINSNKFSIDRIREVIKKDSPKLKVNIELSVGDIRDYSYVDELFSSKGPFLGVIHFCGLKSVSQSMEKPIEYWDVNVLGTITLVKVMKKYRCHTIVFSSSATVYGLPNSIPIKENFEVKPINTYGITKSIVEKILFDLHQELEDQFRIAILRYFNPIGAHDTGLIGEYVTSEPNNIFPLLNQVALGIRPIFEIYGKDWPTKDGTCIRDYIHIMDLAKGHILALDYLLTNNPGFITINLGNGEGVSVLDLIRTFEKVNNVELPFKYVKRRIGDVPVLVADNQLAIKILKWKPIKKLDDMCLDEWRWQLKKSNIKTN